MNPRNVINALSILGLEFDAGEAGLAIPLKHIDQLKAHFEKETGQKAGYFSTLNSIAGIKLMELPE